MSTCGLSMFGVDSESASVLGIQDLNFTLCPFRECWAGIRPLKYLWFWNWTEPDLPWDSVPIGALLVVGEQA